MSAAASLPSFRPTRPLVLLLLLWPVMQWTVEASSSSRGRGVGQEDSGGSSSSVGGLLERAVKLHAGGGLESSRELYESVLSVEPRHVTALHNLAALHHTLGQHTTALDLVGRAIKAGHDQFASASSPSGGPNSSSSNVTSMSELAAAYNTQGLVLRALGDMEGAYRSLHESLSLRPENPAAHVNVAELILQSHECWPESGRRPDCLRAAAQHYRMGLQQDLASRGGGVVLDRRTVLNDFALGLLELGELGECLSCLKEALQLDPSSLQTRGNLAIAYKEAGLFADAMGQALAASQLAPQDPRLLYNLGLLHRHMADSTHMSSGQRAKEERLAEVYFRRALEVDPHLHQALASLGHMAGHVGDVEGAAEYYRAAYRAAMAKGDRLEANSLRLQVATAVVPHIYNSTQHMKLVRARWELNLGALLSLPVPPLLPDPLTSTGSGSLGYYLLYQGQQDLHVRKLLAQVYWRSCPVLRYTAPFLLQPPPPMTGKGSKRLRVGFLSAFFYHHSVGLLLQGVMTSLDRTRYEVVAIMVPPVPPDSDEVARRIVGGVEQVVVLPQQLGAAQRAVGDLELDVLVLGEVGMDPTTYFLAFARLARRTALFWGHAVTSGITAADAPPPQAAAAAEEQHSSSWLPVGGGPDWFISSSLFETQDLASQSRYSEALYLMKGLTTYFLPPPPRPALPTITRESLGLLPPATGGGGPLYLLPQTLYKLHPDMDGMLRDLLLLDPTAVLVMPQAQRPEWTRQLLARLEGSMGQEVVSKQVRLVRRLAHGEYLEMAAMADVVLDPFPVGGGRSSFEILAQGTPIVVLYPRTSILQLTTAMYRHMGLSPAHLSLLVTTSPARYLHAAHSLAHDPALRAAVSHDITKNVHKLYRSEEVLLEWDRFLQYITSHPRPDPAHPRPVASRDLPETITTPPPPPPPQASQEKTTTPPSPSEQRHQQQQPSSSSSWAWVRVGGWGWMARRGAALAMGQQQQPVTSHPDLLYAMKMAADLPPPQQKGEEEATPQQGNFIVEVWRGGPSAVEVGASFCAFLQAEPIRCRHIQRLLALGATRQQESRVAWAGRLEMVVGQEEVVSMEVDVRHGEDVTAAVYWHAYRLDLSLPPPELAALVQGVKEEVAALAWEVDKPAWLAAREARARRALLPPPQPPDDSSSTGGGGGRPSPSTTTAAATTAADRCLASLPFPGDDGVVTLAMTTCKRLSHFRVTMSSLLRVTGPLPNALITRVLVVDDGSSPQDLAAMSSEFPFIELVARDQGSSSRGKGHAHSMNRLVTMVTTRYLLYLEDDWETITNTTASRGGDEQQDFLATALGVLQASQREESGVEALSQVLINGQSSRACAYSVFPDCHMDPHRNRGGWPRQVVSSSSRGPATLLSYNLHEFGSLDHDFSYWPGLSLNPALWDLDLIKCALLTTTTAGPAAAAGGRMRVKGEEEVGMRGRMMFDPEDVRFEQSWSLRGHDAGLRVAHLPTNVFAHVGTDVSAYVINGHPRPWDSRQQQQQQQQQQEENHHHSTNNTT